MNIVDVSLHQNLFWLHIMEEHALFIQLGLPCNETSLIREAQELKKLFASLLTQAHQIPRNQESVAKLNVAIISALDRLIMFKSGILWQKINCQLGGSNLPLFLDHLRREAINFRTLLILMQNSITLPAAEKALQEQIFWLRIMGEHAHFIAHLLDPSERMLVNRSRQLAECFETLRLQALDLQTMVNPRTFENWLLPEKQTKPLPLGIGKGLPLDRSIPRLKRFNQTVIRAIKDIRDFKIKAGQLIKTCTVLSNIPPLMADHVLREALHSLEDLKMFGEELMKTGK